MDEQNPWWSGNSDHVYKEWEGSEVRWTPAIVERLRTRPFSLHFLFGPRQVGKTTALKLLVRKELEERDPYSILYYSCDELTGHEELGAVLDDYISARNARNIKGSLILLDEVTMVDGWWRAVKARVDRGVFSKDTLIVTGSASMELLKQRELFPGRRGHGEDHLMLPLSFGEYARTVGGLDVKTGGVEALARNADANTMHRSRLRELLDAYLTTGGFPRSVKDHASAGHVSRGTMKACLDWARGDWAKVGRSDSYMKEVLAYILRARGTPISWNGISSETSINSPHTARSYVETLEGLFMAISLPLLAPNGKVEHKKNRKVHLTDPLLYSVFSKYAGCEVLGETILEATVASHVARSATPYYWRNGRGEVDVVCKGRGGTYGLEVTASRKKRLFKPFHIKKLYILDRDTAPAHIAALGTS